MANETENERPDTDKTTTEESETVSVGDTLDEFAADYANKGGTADALESTDITTPSAAPPVTGIVPSGYDDSLKAIRDLDAVYDIPVQLSAVLGRSSMQVSQLLKLGRGAIVELDRKVGEAIDIYVNNRLVARGEVVVVEDRLGVTMTEIIKTDRGN